MEQVGYDTYCKLLDQVIKEIQGIETVEEQDVQIDLSVSCYIPDEYIESSSQKIEIYQDIALCRTDDDIRNVIDEIIDRYGPMPKEVENLINVAEIKELARRNNIVKISQKQNAIMFLYDIKKFDVGIVDGIVKKYAHRVRFSPGKDPYITLRLDENASDKKVFSEIKEFLEGVIYASNN